MKLPTRTERLNQLRANIGTIRETPLTHERIAQYEAMSDEQFNRHIASTRNSTVTRLAGEVK